jgi:hypothetical protein
VSGAVVWSPPSSNEARALSCRRRPDVEVLYPAKGEALQVNSAILLSSRRIFSARASRLGLVDDRGNQVPARLAWDETSTLLRLQPGHLMVGRRYAVQHHGEEIRRFRVVPGRVSGRRPALGKASVELSRVITGAVPYRRTGRDAWAVLGGLSKETVVVETRVVFGSPPNDLKRATEVGTRLARLQKERSRRAARFSNDQRNELHRLSREAWELRRTSFVHRRSARLQVASVGACNPHRPAPIKGAYWVWLRPWSRAGRAGRSLTLNGRIEREAPRPIPNQTRTMATATTRIGVGGGMMHTGSLFVVVLPNTLPEGVTFTVTQHRVPLLKLEKVLRPDSYQPFGDLYTIRMDPSIVFPDDRQFHLVFSYEPKDVPAGFRPENLAVLHYAEGIPPYPGHPTMVFPEVTDVDTRRRKVWCSFPFTNLKGRQTYQLLAAVRRPKIEGNTIIWPSTAP